MIIRAARVISVLGCAFIALVAMPTVPAAQIQAAPGTPTYTKDVLPILQRSCQKCHRPGTAAPMSLLTYQEVRPWARSIRQKVSTRQMPPWHIDRSIGEYLEDPSLSDAEIATMVKWIDNGLPQGNPADAPPPLTFSAVTEWTYGEPDLVVEMKEGFVIPPTGPDFTPSEVVDPGIKEDRYVKWVQIVPTAWRAVHHSHVYVSMPEGTDTSGLQLGMGSNRDDELDLIEYGAGNDADVFPDGTAKVIKAGSQFRFSSHYHPYGEEMRDRQKVGIKFYPKGVVPKYVVESHRIRTGQGNDWTMQREKVEDLLLSNGVKLDIDQKEMPNGSFIDENSIGSLGNYSIPPNSIAKSERFWVLPQHALIISFQPHMHFRGGRMLIEAVQPDGRRQVLTDATRYEQSWQITYKYKVPHLFPKGTILHTVAWHDNTANNRHNPDPTAWIGAGSRTMDEMGHAWTDIAFLTEQQYAEEFAKRNGTRPSTTTAGGQQQ
jgi:hypothetical protein